VREKTRMRRAKKNLMIRMLSRKGKKTPRREEQRAKLGPSDQLACGGRGQAIVKKPRVGEGTTWKRRFEREKR